MKITPTDEVGSEESLYGDEYEPCGELTIRNKKRKSKSKSDEFKENEVIKECDLGKKSLKVTPEKSSDYGDAYEEDRVLHTSFYLSPYAINLISIVKRNSKTKNDDLAVLSKPKVVLNITSSTMDKFYEMMKERYITISTINQVASEINASSGKVTIIQPKLKIEVNTDEELERVDALILSSVITKVKMLAEEFGTSGSWIVEYLIYMYISGSSLSCYDNFREYCNERMNTLLSILDKFISDSTVTNQDDSNALIRIAYKMLASNVIEATRNNNTFKDMYRNTLNVDVGSEYNINALLVLKKKNGKRSYDESHSRGIFKQKTGGRIEKFGD